MLEETGAQMGTRAIQVGNRIRISSLCRHHDRGEDTKENADGGNQEEKGNDRLDKSGF